MLSLLTSVLSLLSLLTSVLSLLSLLAVLSEESEEPEVSSSRLIWLASLEELSSSEGLSPAFESPPFRNSRCSHGRASSVP